MTGVSEGKTSIYVKYKDQIISNKIEITVEDKAKKAAMEKEAKEVTKKINDIGTVTLDSKKAIEEARKAYDSMSKEAKPLVKNLKVLTDAEKAYDELKKKSDQAKGVENVINQIGEVTLDSEAAIAEARKQYDALPEDVRAMVTNGKTLTDAEASLARRG